MRLPDTLTGLAHDGKPLDLVTAQSGIKHGRDGRQQIAYSIGHAADVGLLHGITAGGPAARKFGLVQRCATFLFVELARFFRTERPLAQRPSTPQPLLGAVSRQGDVPAPRWQTQTTDRTEAKK